MIRQAPALLATAARRGTVSGSRRRASSVRISKSGINSTKRSLLETLNRSVDAVPFAPATVKPPNCAGAALSGWPSRSAQSSKSACRESGEPASAFSPVTRPSRRVTLLPRPRDTGTSPAIRQRKGNGLIFARRKNRAAAFRAISVFSIPPGTFPGALVTVTRL